MTPSEVLQARLDLGLTQDQMAKLLGYGAKSRIAGIEAGRRQPGKSMVLLLEAYLAGYRPSGWPVGRQDHGDGIES